MAARIDRIPATLRSARGTTRPAGVASSGGRRRGRISEIAVGVVVVAVCALGVVLWHSSTTDTEATLVLGRSVRAGEELHADALRVEQLHIGPLVGHVAAVDSASVVGKIATADLAAGTLVSQGLFVARPPVPAGSIVVAAALVPGQFATFQLRPGQSVAAIRTGGLDSGGRDGGEVLAAATVFEIRTLNDSTGTWIVSLLVPESSAPAVASAAAAKTLSLALVAAATP
jgi:hypothetical protein